MFKLVLSWKNVWFEKHRIPCSLRNRLVHVSPLAKGEFANGKDSDYSEKDDKANQDESHPAHKIVAQTKVVIYKLWHNSLAPCLTIKGGFHIAQLSYHETLHYAARQTKEIKIVDIVLWFNCFPVQWRWSKSQTFP